MRTLPIVTTRDVAPTTLQRLTVVPGALTRYLVGITATKTRARAWRENARCLACGTAATTPEATGLVRTVAGDRIACLADCYVDTLTTPEAPQASGYIISSTPRAQARSIEPGVLQEVA